MNPVGGLAVGLEGEESSEQEGVVPFVGGTGVGREGPFVGGVVDPFDGGLAVEPFAGGTGVDPLEGGLAVVPFDADPFVGGEGDPFDGPIRGSISEPFM